LKGIFDTEVVNLEMHELKWAECPKNKRQEIAAELADGDFAYRFQTREGSLASYSAVFCD